jgi:hypothetical protein
MQVFSASLYPNAICLQTTVQAFLTLTTATSPPYHKNIDWAAVTCAAVNICAVLWYYIGQATVSLADCMSSWAGCCPGAWLSPPVAGSCHLLLAPVCQQKHHMSLQSDRTLTAANCANKKTSWPGSKLFTRTHTNSAASLHKSSGKSQSRFLFRNNNAQHIPITTVRHFLWSTAIPWNNGLVTAFKI